MNYLSVVETCFLDAPRGSGRVAWDVLQALHSRGHQVTLFCARFPGSNAPFGIETRDGIEIVRYERPALPRWHPNRLGANVASAGSAARHWLADRDWDTVHIHAPVLGRGVMQAIGRGPRYVTTVHSPIVMEQEVNWSAQGLLGRLKLMFGTDLLKRLERRVLRDSAAIHALSGFTRSKLEAYHGVGDRVTVIPHWCREQTEGRLDKCEARRRLGWPEDQTVFFSVRQLRPRYGLDVAIRAFSELPSRGGYRYYIAGQGPLRPVLERQIENAGLAGHVSLMGRITDAQLMLAYQAADVFILPTLALECFGLIILESLSWGCPLIATDAGAIPEVLGRVLPGCTIPAGDVASLKHKILDALEHRLNMPAPDELAAQTRENYAEADVVMKLAELLFPETHR
ncbi:MAG: glycosyltransferase family 4 protein [Deferrisomatales bacterium]|nr:glycosyltransferase family 4 protein [Deferrisomatales bacterium]